MSGSNNYNEQVCFVTVDTAINRSVIVWERTVHLQGNIHLQRKLQWLGCIRWCFAAGLLFDFHRHGLWSTLMANRSASALDSCNFPSASPHHRTIFWVVLPSAVDTIWFGRDTKVSQFQPTIFIELNRNLSLIAQVAGTIFNYTDASAPVGPVIISWRRCTQVAAVILRCD